MKQMSYYTPTKNFSPIRALVCVHEAKTLNSQYSIREAIVINHEVKLGKISQQGGRVSRQNKKIPNEIFDCGKSHKFPNPILYIMGKASKVVQMFQI